MADEDKKKKKKKKKRIKRILLVSLFPILTVVFIIILVSSALIGIGMLLIRAYNSIVRGFAEMGQDDQRVELISRILDENEPIEALSANELHFVFEKLGMITNNSDVNKAKELANIGPFSKDDFLRILEEVGKYEDDAYLFNFWYETDYLRTFTDSELIAAYEEAYADVKNLNRLYGSTSDSWFAGQFEELTNIHELYIEWIDGTDDIHFDNYNIIVMYTEWWQENAETLHYDPVAEYIIKHDWAAPDGTGEPLYSYDSYKQFLGTDEKGLWPNKHYFHLDFLLYTTGQTYAPLGTAGSTMFVPQPNPQGDNYVYTYSYPMRSTQQKTDMGYYRDLYYKYGVTWQYVYAACAVHAMLKGDIYTDSGSSGTEPETTKSQPKTPNVPKETMVEIHAGVPDSVKDIVESQAEGERSFMNSSLRLKLDVDFLVDLTEKLCGKQSLTTHYEHNIGNGIKDVRQRINEEAEFGNDWFANYERREEHPLCFSRTAHYPHMGESKVVYIGQGYSTIRDVEPTYALDTFTSLLVNITTTTDANHEKTVSEKIEYYGGGLIEDTISSVFDDYGQAYPSSLFNMCLKDLPGGEYLKEKMNTEKATLNLTKDNAAYKDVVTGADKEFREVIYATEYDKAGYGSLMYGTERPEFSLNVKIPSAGQYIPDMKNVYFFETSSGNASGQTAYCSKEDKKKMQLYLSSQEGISGAKFVPMEELFNRMKGTLNEEFYRNMVPCNNRIASTCIPFYTDQFGGTNAAYMRALTDDEIAAIMSRTGLYQSKLVDTVHMYDIVLTALHSVGKIQYASESQQKTAKGYQGLDLDHYWNELVNDDRSFRDMIGHLGGIDSVTDWINDPTGMFIQYTDLGYYGPLTYPTAYYSKYKLDKYVWTKDDERYDPLRINLDNYDKKSEYLPIYEASDMGYLLWLYYTAGRNALDYESDSGYTSNVMNILMNYGISGDLTGSPDVEQTILQNITFKDVTKNSPYGKASAEGWCVGDIIIAVKNKDNSAEADKQAYNMGMPFMTKNGEKNYHAFMYIGPTNASYTQIAIVECVGDPMWANEHEQPTSELQGGVAYSVIDLKADCDQGTEFYRYQVTLHGQSDYTGLPKDAYNYNAITEKLEAVEHVAAGFYDVAAGTVKKLAEIAEEEARKAIKDYYGY